MKKELKDKWITALRSGEYTQAYGSLKLAPGCFCAIGLLYEVAIGVWEEYDSPVSARIIYFTQDRREAVLDDTDKKFGLPREQMFHIMKMNDLIGQNATFEEIANYVEEYVEVEE